MRHVDRSGARAPRALPVLGIGAIFKNEKPYVVEWLAHHRLMGVERFFIADNESTDGTTELLEALQACGYLVSYRIPTPQGDSPQLVAYRYMVARHGHEVDWLAFIDADEFIWPTGDQESLPAFVQSMSVRWPDLGALVLNWATYGSAGQMHHTPGLVVERFNWHAQRDHFANVAIKTLFRPADFVDVTCAHNVLLVDGRSHRHTDGELRRTHPDYIDIPEKRYIRSDRVCWEGFRINHYVIKSYQEFEQRKRRKGRAFIQRSLGTNYFLWHDNNEQHMPACPHRLARLRAEITRIEEALAAVGWVDNSAVGSADGLRPPIGGRVGQVIRTPEGLLLRGWCKPWAPIKLRQLAAVVNGKVYPAHRFEPAPLLATHRPDPGLKAPQKYINPQASEDSGFEAFVPLDSAIAIDTFEIAGLTADGVLTQPLEQDGALL